MPIILTHKILIFVFQGSFCRRTPHVFSIDVKFYPFPLRMLLGGYSSIKQSFLERFYSNDESQMVWWQKLSCWKKISKPALLSCWLYCRKADVTNDSKIHTGNRMITFCPGASKTSFSWKNYWTDCWEMNWVPWKKQTLKRMGHHCLAMSLSIYHLVFTTRPLWCIDASMTWLYNWFHISN